MDPTEAQPESDLAATYFDPDELDTSEEQFSASIESSFERPRFVVDEAVAAAPQELDDPPIKESRQQTFTSEVGPPTKSLGSEATQSAGEVHDWRDQVSAKISHYKARRPLKEHYPSLSLPFEAEGRERRTQSFSASLASVWDHSIAEEKPAPYPPIVLESTARVLEFPRPTSQPRSDELAEAVIDMPRIIEAPEMLPPPPALGGILIQPVIPPEPARRVGIDVPLQSSTISRRVFAGAVDGFVITLAFLAFGYVFLRISGTVPALKSAPLLTAGLLFMLWAAYQYSFLTFTGTTPGLRLARLRVSRFDGAPAARSLRRWRMLASVLSCVSLGLGYAWCFLDEDQLSWHDRITKTHLAPR